MNQSVIGEESKEAETQLKSGIIYQKPLARQVHANSSLHIPAWYYRNPSSSKLLLYFHGNAECLTLAEQ